MISVAAELRKHLDMKKIYDILEQGTDPKLYGENPDRSMSDRCNYCIRNYGIWEIRNESRTGKCKTNGYRETQL